MATRVPAAVAQRHSLGMRSARKVGFGDRLRHLSFFSCSALPPEVPSELTTPRKSRDVQQATTDLEQQAEGLMRSILDYRLFQVAGQDVYVHSLCIFLGVVMATFVASYLAQRAVGRVLARREVEEEGSLAVFKRLLHYLIIAIGLTTGLATLGFDLAALFAASAIFAVALGFAMQNIAQNFVSGVILLIERTIKPYDVLDLNGRAVRVQSMGIRSTIVRTLDDEDLIVPNAELVQTIVTNYTLRDKLYRLRVPVGVAYESDLRLVESALQQATAAIPWRIQERDPRIHLIAFGSSSVDFEVSVWINQPWDMGQRRSDLHHVVWWALKDAGVTIAFPQIDVHFDATTQESITGRHPSNGGEND